MNRIIACGSLAVIAALLTGCTTTLDVPEEIPANTPVVQNTNPRKGWVQVQAYGDTDDSTLLATTEFGIWKKCDGKTLLYMSIAFGPSVSITTVPDSSECVG